MPNAWERHSRRRSDIATLEYITGKKVAMVAGKPSKLMMTVVMERMGLPPERCIMIGDRLETDLKMGQDAGMQTAMVLTGVSTAKDARRISKASDFILENLYQLLDKVE